MLPFAPEPLADPGRGGRAGAAGGQPWEPAAHGRTRVSDANGATVLLVEDDDSLRTEVARNLAGHGYRVVEAGDAEEALRRWQ